jgi:predicted amidohydrolase
MKIRVAGAQIPVLGDIGCNKDSIEMALDYAIEEKADILLTPEGSLSGYHPHFDQKQVDEELSYILERAKKAHLGLALGTCYKEPSDSEIYNQIRFYDKNGAFLGFHSKILKTTGESSHYKSSPLRTFQFENLTIGGLICNDLWANPGCTVEPDPHLTQELANRGAKIIFHAINGGRSDDPFMETVRQYHESNLLMRANAGKIWIVCVDNCFPFGVKCSAPSGVINPEGKWVFKAPLLNDHCFVYDIEIV